MICLAEQLHLRDQEHALGQTGVVRLCKKNHKLINLLIYWRLVM